MGFTGFGSANLMIHKSEVKFTSLLSFSFSRRECIYAFRGTDKSVPYNNLTNYAVSICKQSGIILDIFTFHFSCAIINIVEYLTTYLGTKRREIR